MPGQLPGVTESLWVIVTGPLQSSVALALPVLLTLVEAVQLMFVLAGQKVKVGGVESTTETIFEQVLEQPLVSVMLSDRVKEPLQVLAALTLTVCALDAPSMVPLPVTDQL